MGVEVTFDGERINRERFLESLLACREGRCDCPSSEFGKVGALSVHGEGDRVVAGLSPRAGTQFDPKGFMACAKRLLSLAQDAGDGGRAVEGERR